MIFSSHLNYCCGLACPSISLQPSHHSVSPSIITTTNSGRIPSPFYPHCLFLPQPVKGSGIKARTLETLVTRLRRFPNPAKRLPSRLRRTSRACPHVCCCCRCGGWVASGASNIVDELQQLGPNLLREKPITLVVGVNAITLQHRIGKAGSP